MGYYVKPFIDGLDEFLEWVFASKSKRNYLNNVPKYCRNCDILGMCRDKNNNWKCIDGCYYIQEEYRRKHARSRDSIKIPDLKPYRLKNYDYSKPGNYYITVCTKEHKNLFWANAEDYAPIRFFPVLSEYGEAVETAIKSISARYYSMTVNEYMIMPNHIHLILQIHTDEDGKPISSDTVPSAVGYMKNYSNKKIGFNVWEDVFYDYIIRDEWEYDVICDSVQDNYWKWTEDKFYRK